MAAQHIFKDKSYLEYSTLWNKKSCVQQEPQHGDIGSHHRLNQILYLSNEDTIDITTWQCLILKAVSDIVYGSSHQKKS
jgi:hypothetical protein